MIIWTIRSKCCNSNVVLDSTKCSHMLSYEKRNDTLLISCKPTFWNPPLCFVRWVDPCCCWWAHGVPNMAAALPPPTKTMDNIKTDKGTQEKGFKRMNKAVRISVLRTEPTQSPALEALEVFFPRTITETTGMRSSPRSRHILWSCTFAKSLRLRASLGCSNACQKCMGSLQEVY